MFDIDALLGELATRGVKLWVEGEKLKASPASRLTPEYTEAIRAHKLELMALLEGNGTLSLSPPPIKPPPKRVAVTFKLVEVHGNPPHHGGGICIGAPGSSAEELIASLRATYGDSLTSVSVDLVH